MTIIVTGAASGIGRATVRAVARRAPVLALDIDGVGLERTCSELPTTGYDSAWAVVDVRDRDACREAAARAAATGAGLTGLAHCAGVIAGDARLGDLAADAWADIIATNLTGTANLLSAVLPLLVDRGGGDIVVVSSVAALQGRTRIAAYSASKAGVLGLVSSVTADYAREGIRINAVCPGPTDTPMTHGLSNRPPSNGPGRAATPEEIASVIDWLLSPASVWMNGTALPVDAGETAAFTWAFRRSSPS